MAGLVLLAGLTATVLPIGMEFAGLSGMDRKILALGLSLEKVLGPITAPKGLDAERWWPVIKVAGIRAE
jgi:mandelamide amidase